MDVQQSFPLDQITVTEAKRELFNQYDPITLREDPLRGYFGVSLLGIFERCPLEVIEYIISFLEYKDLCTIARLNWWFNIRSESDIFWRTLYSRYFPGVDLSRVSNNWKLEFKDSLLFDDEWSVEKRSRQLRVIGRRQIMIEKGYEWSTCQIGKKSVSEYVKKRWTFRVLGTVGLMVGLVESQWDFVDSYPGTGYYGCTMKHPTLNMESKRANQNLFSLACYEVFDRYDKIQMEVNTKKSRVRFYRNDQLHGQLEYNSKKYPNLTPLCALCGPSSAIEIIPPYKTGSSRNSAMMSKEEILPALSQAQGTASASE